MSSTFQTNQISACRLKYSGTPVTLPCEQRRTLKGNEKQFELAGNSRYRGKFQ